MIKTLLLSGAFALLAIDTSFSQGSTELESERTLYSKTYLREDGMKEQLLSAQPIHYQSNGDWMPIDTKIELSTAGFSNKTNVLQSMFPKSIGVEEEIQLSVGDAIVSFNARKEMITYSETDGIQYLNLSLQTNKGKLDNTAVTYKDVYPDMADRYIVDNGSVKNEFHLMNVPTCLSGINSGYFGFQERIQLPDNWSIEMLGTPNGELITTGLTILDENNVSIFTIPSPVFFENQMLSDDGSSSVQGGFTIDKEGDDWLLSTLVPVEWLKAQGRAYPVVLDPTVTLSGADGGWMSAVNLVNNPAFVFIGVCCGNQEHRAWIKFNTASIPDASCVTNVELEVYVNGVGAATTELVHAYDMTGAFGPYAAIDNNVLTDMADGYYTSFTLDGAGTYGWYDLGPSADALLETQLPGDFYQVSLIFDNEPSTNWKRLTAGLCRLRVTYDDPPCAPLPVGISETYVECVDDYAVMQWTTVTESNNDYFTISRSQNGVDYEDVALVQGEGNSSTEQTYIWRDVDQSKESAYYRLSQTDMDGTTTFYTPLMYHACDQEVPLVFVDEEKNIHVTGHQITYVELHDNMWRPIASANNEGDMNEWVLSNPNFSSGLYTATIHYDGGKYKTITFLYVE